MLGIEPFTFGLSVLVWTLVGVAAACFVSVYIVFRVRAYSRVLGLLTALTLGAAIIRVARYIGYHYMLFQTNQQFEVTLLAAAGGAVVGLSVGLSLFRQRTPGEPVYTLTEDTVEQLGDNLQEELKP